MRRLLVVLALGLGLLIARSASAAAGSLEDLKLEKRFGIGATAAGGLGILGLQIDINVTSDFSMTGGIGTGLDYNSVMVEGKYYLLGKSVSPYIAFGISRWWSDGTNEKHPSPSLLGDKFLKDEINLTQGFDLFIVYPAIGVQFMHAMGFSFYAEAQYMFKLMNMVHGAYAGLGVLWYF